MIKYEDGYIVKSENGWIEKIKANQFKLVPTITESLLELKYVDFNDILQDGSEVLLVEAYDEKVYQFDEATGQILLDEEGNCIIKKAKMPYVSKEMEAVKQQYPGIEEAYEELKLKEKEGLEKTVNPALLRIDMSKVPAARITPAELAVLLPLINYSIKEVYYG